MKHLLTTILLAASFNVYATDNNTGTIQGASAIGSLSTVNSNNNTTNGGNVYSGTNNIQPNEQKVLTTSSVVLAPLTTSGMDTCHGSAQGGVSVPGFNLSGGKTYVDQNCVMLKNSKRLQELGLKDAALVLLMNSDERIKNAIKISNPDVYNAFFKE